MLNRRMMLRGVLLLLAAAAVALYGLREESDSLFGPTSGVVLDSAAATGDRQILEAFHARRSNVVVQVAGRVQRLLDDDNQGSRHQRFILELAGAHTLLVSHNIDLALRVPIASGDGIEVRGEYEWNAQGGVLHWTHHDPRGARQGGWIRHQGQLYR